MASLPSRAEGLQRSVSQRDSAADAGDMAGARYIAIEGNLKKNKSGHLRYAVLWSEDTINGFPPRMEFFADKRLFQKRKTPKRVISIADMMAVAHADRNDMDSHLKQSSSSPPSSPGSMTLPSSLSQYKREPAYFGFVILLRNNNGSSTDTAIPLGCEKRSDCDAWMTLLREFITGTPNAQRLDLDRLWHGLRLSPQDIGKKIISAHGFSDSPCSFGFNSKQVVLIRPQQAQPFFVCQINQLRNCGARQSRLYLHCGRHCPHGEGRMFLEDSQVSARSDRDGALAEEMRAALYDEMLRGAGRKTQQISGSTSSNSSVTNTSSSSHSTRYAPKPGSHHTMSSSMPAGQTYQNTRQAVTLPRQPSDPAAMRHFPTVTGVPMQNAYRHGHSAGTTAAGYHQEQTHTTHAMSHSPLTGHPASHAYINMDSPTDSERISFVRSVSNPCGISPSNLASKPFTEPSSSSAPPPLPSKPKPQPAPTASLIAGSSSLGMSHSIPIGIASRSEAPDLKQQMSDSVVSYENASDHLNVRSVSSSVSSRSPSQEYRPRAGAISHSLRSSTERFQRSDSTSTWGSQDLAPGGSRKSSDTSTRSDASAQLPYDSREMILQGRKLHRRLSSSCGDLLDVSLDELSLLEKSMPSASGSDCDTLRGQSDTSADGQYAILSSSVKDIPVIAGSRVHSPVVSAVGAGKQINEVSATYEVMGPSVSRNVQRSATVLVSPSSSESSQTHSGTGTLTRQDRSRPSRSHTLPIATSPLPSSEAEEQYETMGPPAASYKKSKSQPATSSAEDDRLLLVQPVRPKQSPQIGKKAIGNTPVERQPALSQSVPKDQSDEYMVMNVKPATVSAPEEHARAKQTTPEQSSPGAYEEMSLPRGMQADVKQTPAVEPSQAARAAEISRTGVDYVEMRHPSTATEYVQMRHPSASQANSDQDQYVTMNSDKEPSAREVDPKKEDQYITMNNTERSAQAVDPKKEDQYVTMNNTEPSAQAVDPKKEDQYVNMKQDPQEENVPKAAAENPTQNKPDPAEVNNNSETDLDSTLVLDTGTEGNEERVPPPIPVKQRRRTLTMDSSGEWQASSQARHSKRSDSSHVSLHSQHSVSSSVGSVGGDVVLHPDDVITTRSRSSTGSGRLYAMGAGAAAAAAQDVALRSPSSTSLPHSCGYEFCTTCLSRASPASPLESSPVAQGNHSEVVQRQHAAASVHGTPLRSVSGLDFTELQPVGVVLQKFESISRQHSDQNIMVHSSSSGGSGQHLYHQGSSGSGSMNAHISGSHSSSSGSSALSSASGHHAIDYAASRFQHHRYEDVLPTGSDRASPALVSSKSTISGPIPIGSGSSGKHQSSVLADATGENSLSWAPGAMASSDGLFTIDLWSTPEQQEPGAVLRNPYENAMIRAPPTEATAVKLHRQASRHGRYFSPDMTLDFVGEQEMESVDSGFGSRSAKAHKRSLDRSGSDISSSTSPQSEATERLLYQKVAFGEAKTPGSTSGQKESTNYQVVSPDKTQALHRAIKQTQEDRELSPPPP
eukprot:scpid39337/ scgid7720/ 